MGEKTLTISLRFVYNTVVFLSPRFNRKGMTYSKHILILGILTLLTRLNLAENDDSYQREKMKAFRERERNSEPKPTPSIWSEKFWFNANSPGYVILWCLPFLLIGLCCCYQCVRSWQECSRRPDVVNIRQQPEQLLSGPPRSPS